MPIQTYNNYGYSNLAPLPLFITPIPPPPLIPYDINKLLTPDLSNIVGPITITPNGTLGSGSNPNIYFGDVVINTNADTITYLPYLIISGNLTINYSSTLTTTGNILPNLLIVTGDVTISTQLGGVMYSNDLSNL